MPSKATVEVSSEQVERSIYFIRGHRVMLDADLAEMYGVSTKVLVQAVKRNVRRFPLDFMFQLSIQELRDLRSQFATSSWGGRRTQPYAFTEQGIAMLSTVLHSDRAIDVNIAIIRVFVRMRQLAAAHKDLARKIEALERKYDGQFEVVFEAIRELMTPPEPRRKGRIGF